MGGVATVLTFAISYWLLIAVSLFNLILLLWLGLTVLLNADRRRNSLGIWLAGGGLLMGEAFFICHTAIIGLNFHTISLQLNAWWQSVWISIIATPFAWYVAMLWYAGVRRGARSPWLRRHLPWFGLTVLFGLTLIVLQVLTRPPLQRDMSFASAPALAGIPLLVLLYPCFSMLCIVLSLDVIRHPGATTRMMGDLARRRAQPWVVGASLVLLAVSLLLAGCIGWLVLTDRQRPIVMASHHFIYAVAWLDLAVESLIALAVILTGQAIVAYEIFTGLTLPRRALLAQWRRVLILAGGFSLLVAASLVLQDPPIYLLLLATMLMVGFIALAGRRSYLERERYFELLRPFVASQRIYDALLTGADAPEMPTEAPFRALCAEVLDARVAYLAAVGSLAPLAGAPLAYPDDAPPLPALGELVARCENPETVCFALEAPRYGGAAWAVPLWNAHRLIGVLLLGEKRDGGLYTREEMEIARAGGERLLDIRASASIAQRLMALQRQRLAETRVVDHRTRRLLHDEILPRLHTAMLTMSAAAETPGMQEGLQQLGEVHREISDLLRAMPSALPEVASLGLLGALRRVVQHESSGAFDALEWQVSPAAERRAAALPALAAEVAFYAAREAVRNAAHYGRGGEASRALHLRISADTADGLRLLIADDGIGVGMAMAASHGSGQGLVLHSTMMAVIGGALAVESAPGQYTRIILTLPSSVEGVSASLANLSDCCTDY